MLGEAGVPVACYGNLATELPGVPGNLLAVPGHIPFGPRLVAALVRHPITVDVLSPGFIEGFSHKVIHTFEAGGFMLTDRKRDFIGAFGDVGEAASYTDGADLAAKIDLYLGKPALRREVAAEMRQRIDARHSLKDVLTRVLAEAAARPRRPGVPVAPPRPPVAALDLLPRMHRHLTLNWRTVGFRRSRSGVHVSCTTVDWGYAARAKLPERTARLREPHIRLTVEVEQGRLGAGLLHDPKAALIGEKYAGPSRRPVTFVLELESGTRPMLVLRKASDQPLRAIVSEAVLCERPA
ncbi:MAG: glycosyltransferase [Alphaproteobacteria bacterium]|nr:glycosyltransferase [Alphaproteobacteria bacterium]